MSLGIFSFFSTYLFNNSARTFYNSKTVPICVDSKAVAKAVHYAIYTPGKKIPGDFEGVYEASIIFCDWIFSDFNPEHKPTWLKKEDILES